MSIKGYGDGIDITCKLDSSLKTTTSQFAVVGMVPGTSTSESFTVCIAGQNGTVSNATAAAYYAVGIIQSYQSSGSENGTVRLFGVSKATCAESIAAGQFVMAYWGASTTTMVGKIVQIDDAVSCSAATTSITAHAVVLGRALSNGSTNSVITVFLNPQLYDMALVGSIGIT